VKMINSQQELRAEFSANPSSLIVVDFFATWCGPCQRIAPLYAELSTKYQNVRFLKVDVDQAPNLAQECGVTAMPTFHLYRRGSKVDELRGADPHGLEERVKQHSAGSVLADQSMFEGTGHRLGGGEVVGEQRVSNTAVGNAQPPPLRSTHPIETPEEEQESGPEVEAVVRAVREMGFSREAAIAGIRTIGAADLESVVEWVLLNQPPASEDHPSGSLPSESITAPASAPSFPTPSPSSDSGVRTTLAIRLADGSTIKHEFRAEDTLHTVRQFIVNKQGISNFDLMTPYPRKVLSAAESGSTLAELDLVPNANLILRKK